MIARATVRQKKFIWYINKKLGMTDKENLEVLNKIQTFQEADSYIKKYLPIVKVKDLSFEEIRFLCYKLLIEIESLLVTGRR